MMNMRRLAAGVLCFAACSAAEFGVASWYGFPLNGRLAADGSVFDMEKPTAAHRTLPLGTWVRVTNMATNRSVDVRISDRGPFIDGRIIDLSRAAARALDIVEAGTAQVRIDVLPGAPGVIPADVAAATPNSAAGPFAVQVGAFRSKDNAERLRARMQQEFGSARIVEVPGETPLWRVYAGGESTMAGALRLAARIRPSVGSAFAARIDNATQAYNSSPGNE